MSGDYLLALLGHSGELLDQCALSFASDTASLFRPVLQRLKRQCSAPDPHLSASNVWKTNGFNGACGIGLMASGL
jgi:hypothetical protein